MSLPSATLEGASHLVGLDCRSEMGDYDAQNHGPDPHITRTRLRRSSLTKTRHRPAPAKWSAGSRLSTIYEEVSPGCATTVNSPMEDQTSRRVSGLDSGPLPAPHTINKSATQLSRRTPKQNSTPTNPAEQPYMNLILPHSISMAPKETSISTGPTRILENWNTRPTRCTHATSIYTYSRKHG